VLETGDGLQHRALSAEEHGPLLVCPSLAHCIRSLLPPTLCYHCYAEPSSQVKLNLETKDRDTKQISLDATNTGLQQQDCKKERSGPTASSQLHPLAHF